MKIPDHAVKSLDRCAFCGDRRVYWVGYSRRAERHRYNLRKMDVRYCVNCRQAWWSARTGRVMKIKPELVRGPIRQAETVIEAFEAYL